VVELNDIVREKATYILKDERLRLQKRFSNNSGFLDVTKYDKSIPDHFKKIIEEDNTIPKMSDETWRAMVQLSRESKAKAIGVSNYDIQDLKELLGDFDITPAVNQVEFHPFLYQQDLLQFCEKNRIQPEAYSPLTRGERLSHPKLLKLAKKGSVKS
jgi:diketogulonate reductase-like aldo/keto reductase